MQETRNIPLKLLTNEITFTRLMPSKGSNSRPSVKTTSVPVSMNNNNNLCGLLFQLSWKYYCSALICSMEAPIDRQYANKWVELFTSKILFPKPVSLQAINFWPLVCKCYNFRITYESKDAFAINFYKWCKM